MRETWRMYLLMMAGSMAGTAIAILMLELGYQALTAYRQRKAKPEESKQSAN